jgi:VWFA-related protein
VQPITIVVMLDRSASMEKKFDLVKKAAATFVEQLLPGDRARIGSFSTKVQIDPEAFTSDTAALRDILEHRLLPPGPTPLWSATAAAIDALKGEDGRRVVLVFTDGMDSSTPRTMTTSFDQVLTRVETEDVMVYAVGLAGCDAPAPPAMLGAASVPAFAVAQKRGHGRGGGVRMPQLPPPPTRGRLPPRGPASPPRIPGLPPPGGTLGKPPVTVKPAEPVPCRDSEPAPNLKELAEAGGGGYFKLRSANGLGATFARVADELHHQYLLAFPASTFDGRMHTIEVRVKPAHLTVRARKSYLAPVEK